MAADLNELIRKQHELQLAIGGTDPKTRTPEQQMEFLREMAWALVSELNEAMDETGWKTWASSNHINSDAMFSELCDALQFWMNMVTLLGKTGDDVADQLNRKRVKNWARVNGNYDGVSDKCPTCKRAFDDDAVLCKPGHCAHTYQIVDLTV